MRVLILTSVRGRLKTIVRTLKVVYDASTISYDHITNYWELVDLFFYEEQHEKFDLIILDPVFGGVDTGYSFIYHMVEHRVKKDIIFFAPDCKNTCKKELEAFLVPSFETYKSSFKTEINREIIKTKYKRSLILNNSDYYFAENCFKGEAHDKFELFHVLTSYRDKQNKEIKDEE